MAALEASKSAPALSVHASTSKDAAPFLRRTWNLITDKSTDGIIAWSSNGSSFTVRDPDGLAAILPKRFGLFRESYGGFVRELALYGFRCVASDAFGRPVTFAVEHFERGKFHSLARVRRKANYGRSRRM